MTHKLTRAEFNEWLAAFEEAAPDCVPSDPAMVDAFFDGVRVHDGDVIRRALARKLERADAIDALKRAPFPFWLC